MSPLSRNSVLSLGSKHSFSQACFLSVLSAWCLWDLYYLGDPGSSNSPFLLSLPSALLRALALRYQVHGDQWVSPSRLGVGDGKQFAAG